MLSYWEAGGCVATWTSKELQGRKTHVGHVGNRVTMTRVANLIARNDTRCFCWLSLKEKLRGNVAFGAEVSQAE